MIGDNPLAKSFKCQHCEEYFRTRQGLSGHVHFKHGAQEKPEDFTSKVASTLMESEDNKYNTELRCDNAGLSLEDKQIMIKIVEEWKTTVRLSQYLGIALSPSDFKTYVIVRFASTCSPRRGHLQDYHLLSASQSSSMRFIRLSLLDASKRQ